MARFVIIADPETTLGYQLAGVEVLRAPDFDSARAQLLALLNAADVGLVAVSADLIAKLDEATRRRVETGYQPVVISLPTGGPVMGFTSRRAYLTALIRRAIGSQITFAGEEDATR